ncbi:MAG: hypothetical protein HOW73_08330 [Polyangiaceae bacterium]|nr:hypothetical protein [Polyangiaceae bacterium]
MVVDKTRTLAREGLSPDAWAKIEQRCAILLAAAIENDRAEMRDAYDAAFLEARAAHRGHFGREAHAELRDELLGGKVVETDLVLDVADAIRVRRLNNRSA